MLSRLDLSGNPLHDHGALFILSGATTLCPPPLPTRDTHHVHAAGERVLVGLYPCVLARPLHARADRAPINARHAHQCTSRCTCPLRSRARLCARAARVACRNARGHACKRRRRARIPPACKLRACAHGRGAVCMDGEWVGRGGCVARARLLESAASAHRAATGQSPPSGSALSCTRFFPWNTLPPEPAALLRSRAVRLRLILRIASRTTRRLSVAVVIRRFPFVFFPHFCVRSCVHRLLPIHEFRSLPPSQPRHPRSARPQQPCQWKRGRSE